MRLLSSTSEVIVPAPDPLSSSSLILTILALIGVLIAAYYTTKFLSTRMLKSGVVKKKPGRYGKKVLGQYVNIVDRAPIDKEKSVLVVEFEGKFYLVGVSPHGVNLLDKCEISQEEYEARRKEQEEEERLREKMAGSTSFMDIFKQQFSQKFRSKSQKRAQNRTDNTFKDELDVQMQEKQDDIKHQDEQN